MSYVIQAYDDALALILKYGVTRTNKRTGIKTKSVFGITSRYRLDEAFPLVNRRKVWPKSIFGELLWFISGSTNNNDLLALGSKIWNPWVDEEFEHKHGYASGCFGPVYGFQLRHFGGFYGNGIGGEAHTRATTVAPDGPTGWAENSYGAGGFDQLSWMINRIKEDPTCRRILFSLWNPKETAKMKLPPCHYTFQILIDDEGRMTGVMTQRSCDFPIGVPANIQFYSALTMMIAQQTGFQAYEFVHNTVDSHIYWDQIPAIEEYLSLPTFVSPKLTINPAQDIFSYKLEDFVLHGYECGPKLEIPVAV